MNEINGFTLSFPTRLQATELSGDEKWNENDCEHMNSSNNIENLILIYYFWQKKGVFPSSKLSYRWVIYSATSSSPARQRLEDKNTKILIDTKYL